MVEFLRDENMYVGGVKEYRFEDLYIGLEEHFTVTITETMMSDFKKNTGDKNPLHTDADYAYNLGYSGCVVYGMLTASFISTLGGVYLPGRYCLIHSVESKFLKPVFVGDKLNISGTVEELHESVCQASIKVLITNQKQEKVLKGKLKVGVLHE